MADAKTTALTDVVTPDAGDLVPIVDVSDTTMSAGGTNKKATMTEVMTLAPVQSVASKTGAVTLVKGDVGLGSVDNTADASKTVAAANAIKSATTTVDTSAATAPSTGQVLTATDSTHATWQTPTGGGGGGSGQTTYDAIVAATGGDYTTLTAALAAASAGWRIFVKAGTYTESAISCILSGITIVGAGRNSVTLNMGTNSFELSGTHATIQSLGIVFSGGGPLTLSGDFSTADNCRVVSDYISVLSQSGNHSVSKNMHITCTSSDTTRTNQYISLAGACTMTNSFISTNLNGTTNTPAINLAGTATFVNNRVSVTAGFRVVITMGGSAIMTGNTMQGVSTATAIRSVGANNQIVANNIQGFRFGVQDDSGGTIIEGNYITVENNSTGIVCASSNSVITGNRLVGASTTNTFGINANADTTVSGNQLSVFDTAILLSGTYGTCTNNRVKGCLTGIYVGAANNIVTSNSTQSCTTGVNDASTGTVLANNI